MTEHGTSGRDLARLALAQYKAAAKNRPTISAKPRAKRSQSHHGTGRDPIGLGAVITRLSEDREWKTGVAGGDILDQWPQLAPDLAGKVAAVHYDPDLGRLDLRPASHAYGAQVRLIGGQLAERINTKLGGAPVRTIRVLAPGPIDPGGAPAGQQPSAGRHAAAAPVRTRDDACPGYHQTLDAINRTPPAGQKPRLQREYGVGEYAHLREAPEKFTDAVAALETAAAADQGNDPDAVRQAAIRIARAQKAGHAPAVTTVFQRTA
ncbi:MAG: DUF721 domain-containing protein [Streptomyces sp.]|nr:DUF721 domain-containing protein [Streptomyces sp.]